MTAFGEPVNSQPFGEHDLYALPEGPQNTGASAVDHDLHRTVGKDAQQKWDVIDDRKAYKKSVAESEGRDLGDLSRTPDGDYRVLEGDEREKLEGAVQHVAHINKLVQDHRKKRKLRS